MSTLSQSEKSKSLSFFLKIFLTCLFCVLSLFDAPEYMHCTHIGVCEFLELHAHLKPSQEVENIFIRIKKGLNHHFSYHYAFFIEYYSHCPQRCNDLSLSPVFSGNVGLSVPFYILSRYVYPDYKKIIRSPFNKGHKLLVKKEHIFPVASKLLPSQPLQIISTSIINS